MTVYVDSIEKITEKEHVTFGKLFHWQNCSSCDGLQPHEEIGNEVHDKLISSSGLRRAAPDRLLTIPKNI